MSDGGWGSIGHTESSRRTSASSSALWATTTHLAGGEAHDGCGAGAAALQCAINVLVPAGGQGQMDASSQISKDSQQEASEGSVLVCCNQKAPVGQL